MSPQAYTRSPRTGGARHPAGLTLITIAVVVAGLHLARDVLIPLALAILLSFLLAPLVKRFQKWKLRRIPAVVLALLLASFVIGIVGWAVYIQLGDLISHLPEHRGKIRERILAIRERFDRSNEKVDQVIETVTEAIESENAGGKDAPEAAAPDDPRASGRDAPSLPPGSRDRPILVATVDTMPSLLLRLQGAMAPFLNPLSAASVVGILVIFLLLQGEDLRDRIIRLAGQGRLSGTTEAINDAVERVSRYLLVQAVLNGFYGTVIAVGLLVIGVPSWALWGFLCAAFRFIPYIGPWLGALAPFILSFATAEGDLWWLQLLEVAGLFLVMELIVNLVLEPWLYGTSTGVTPFGILAAAVFWTWIWGPMGLLLATPLTVCCVVLGKHFPQLGYLHVLLGEDEALSPTERYYQRILANDATGARAVASTLLRQEPLAAALDALLAALVLSERDWMHGDLREEKREALHESLLEVVATLEGDGQSAPNDRGEDVRSAAGPVSSRPRLVVLPARGEGEAVAAVLLAALAKARGFACEALHEDLLLAETIARTESSEANAVLLAVLPSTRVRRVRILVKRLRAPLPAIKVVIVACGQEGRLRKLRERLLPSADGVAASAAGAIKELERIGLHPPVPAPASAAEEAGA